MSFEILSACAHMQKQTQEYLLPLRKMTQSVNDVLPFFFAIVVSKGKNMHSSFLFPH